MVTVSIDRKTYEMLERVKEVLGYETVEDVLVFLINSAYELFVLGK